MRKIYFSILLAFCFVALNAQQDAMFTHYMFNSLSFNPAYAGSHDFMTADLVYRNQWFQEINGAPISQSFNIHSPYKENVGLGFGIINDKIGVKNVLTTHFDYAYKIPFGKGVLSMGLSAGIINMRTDWDRLDYHDPQIGDESFRDHILNKWIPNFGAGIYYHTNKYYLGFGAPRLINSELRKTTNNDIERIASLYRHYFFMGGIAIPVNGKDFVLKPSFIIRNVGGFGKFGSAQNAEGYIYAPTSIDLDLSLLMFEKFWVGSAYRTAIQHVVGKGSSDDSIDFWMTYLIRNSTRIGAAFDLPISRLKHFTNGAFELMVGYDFNYKIQNVETPRYF